MLTGVKYCGGCRASFDRKSEAERVLSEIHGEAGKDPADFLITDAVTGGRYDVLLVVCGCRTKCPDIGAYGYDRLVYIDERGRNEKK